MPRDSRRRSTMVSVAVAVAMIVLTLAPAIAVQDSTVQEPGFTKFDPAELETLPATPLVFAAYGFCWVALFVYVFVIWRRLGRIPLCSRRSARSRS